MRKSEHEPNIWWVALVTAVVAEAVDRAADVVWPTTDEPVREASGCETRFVEDDDQARHNDREIALAWKKMQQPVCEPARELLQRHLKPAPYRGARREPQFRLSLSVEQNDPAECALYNFQSFILLIGALLASGAISLRNTCAVLGQSAQEWRERLYKVAQLDRRLQLPFDIGRLEELLRAIAVLKIVEDSAERTHLHALELQRASIELSDEGKFIACGKLYNPNDFSVPSAAICIDYLDQQQRPVGHWVVWPATLGISARENLEFYYPLPDRSGLTPVRLRLARSTKDFWIPRNNDAPPQGGYELFDLVDELTRLLKR